MRVPKIVLFFALLLAGSLGFAQEWSAEQKGVWQAVKELSSTFYSGDMEKAYEWVHPEFVYWGTYSAVPGTRESAWKLDTTWFDQLGGEWHGVTHTPLTIQVFDDIAVVNFYVRGYQKEPGGNAEETNVRWLHVMKKEEGKWLLVANYGHPE